MVKKGLVLLLSSATLTVVAQNQVQQIFLNNNLSNQIQVQQRIQPLLASNSTNLNKLNSVTVRNANNNSGNKTKQSVQRRPVQQVIQRDLNPPVQMINDAIQIQINVSENNIGIQIQQISNVAMPDLPQIGIADFQLKMPEMNWSSKRSTVKTKKVIYSVTVRKKISNKLKRINRKFTSKFLNKNKLRIKVDDCFKW